MHQVQLMGWQPVGRLPEAMLDRYLAATWRHLFHDSLGHRIHLNWQFLPGCRTAEFEATIWESTIETKIHEVPVHILNPADQLLHGCVAGDSLIPRPNFVRAVDAMIITKNFPDLDWNRLLNQASERRLIVPLSAVLGYLQDTLNKPFPPAFWQQLSSIPISDQDFLEYKLITSRPQLWSRFWQIWFDYRRQTATGSIFIDLIGFPQHLQNYWRLSKSSQIPGQALSVVRRRLRIHRGRESLAQSPKL